MAIDLNKLKVDAGQKIKVTRVISNILVGKPSKNSFFRIKTGEGWDLPNLQTFAPDGTGKDSNPYLVQNEECQAYLEDLNLLIPAKFYMYIVYGSGILKVDFISQRLDKLGNLNLYHSSRMAAYELAKTKWVRMYSNTEGGFYSCGYAEDILPEPVWPKEPSNLLAALEIAFKGYIIEDMDHPKIKELRGKL